MGPELSRITDELLVDTVWRIRRDLDSAVELRKDPDEVFSYSALKEARRRRLRPFEDGDRIAFVTIRHYPRVSQDRETQIRYWDLRLDGQSPNMAEMLATRRFPGVRTDSVWNEGRCNGNQFEKTPALGDHHRHLAEAAGVSTTGKTYLSSLADYPGDPTAWVSDRSDVLRVCRDKNFHCSGFVTHRSPEVPPMPDVAVADDLIRDEVADILESNPGARREDVYERLHDLRTGRVDPNPLLVDED